MPDLLLEIFSEEIPARMQPIAARQLADLVISGFAGAGVTLSRVEPFYSPRRIGFIAYGLPEALSDVIEERKGPRLGALDAAIQGFLKSTGMKLDDLEIQKKGNDEFYIAKLLKKARPIQELACEITENAIAKTPWPKSMRWGSNEMRWIRPMRSILCLLDDAVLPVRYGHLQADRITRGHRFLSSGNIVINNPAEYHYKLREAYVLTNFAERRELILKSLHELAASESLLLEEDEALLAEVCGLVEWPVPLLGSIAPEYMELPPEILRSVMKNHQRYFSFKDINGAMAPFYATVANIIPHDGGKLIMEGNSRVLRARLEDAKFYWRDDLKTPIADRLETLRDVVHHANIGSMYERVERIIKLSMRIAENAPGADNKLVESAARLCKADLASGVVGEMPEMQGIMGKYIALHQGLPQEVAMALAGHYRPLGQGDKSPQEITTICVAIADKADSLLVLFKAGEKPTGSRDPFALRRAALGIIMILLDNDLNIPMRPILEYGAANLGITTAEQAEILLAEVGGFLLERLRVFMKERGLRHDILDACLSVDKEWALANTVKKAHALAVMLETPDGAILLQGCSRALNILKIEEKKDKAQWPESPNPAIFTTVQEEALLKALNQAQNEIIPFIKSGDFEKAMLALSLLKDPVDNFFNAVMVNDSDASVRLNRLALLAEIQKIMENVADFTRIQGGSGN